MFKIIFKILHSVVETETALGSCLQENGFALAQSRILSEFECWEISKNETFISVEMNWVKNRKTGGLA